MNLKRLLLGLFTWLVYTAAVLFLAVLTAVAVFCFTKALNRQSAQDIWSMLRGEKVVVTQEDRERLAEFDRQTATRSSVEQAEAEGAGRVREELDKRKVQLDAEFKKEHEFLKRLSDQLAASERKLKADAGSLAGDQKKLAQAQKDFQAEKDKSRLSKVLKLYQGMDAELIAGDFETKLKTSDNYEAKFKEVVEILRQMPERQASEVLAAIAKPETRNGLMEALKKS